MLLEEFLKIRPANPKMVEKHQKRMLEEIRAYKQCEQNETTGLPQEPRSHEQVKADKRSTPKQVASL